MQETINVCSVHMFISLRLQTYTVWNFTFPVAFRLSPQASITNGSLTDMQATKSIPLDFMASLSLTKPGKWV